MAAVSAADSERSLSQDRSPQDAVTKDGSVRDRLIQDLYTGTDKRQRDVARTLGTQLKICSQWTEAIEHTASLLIDRFLILASKSSLKPFILSYLDSIDTRIFPPAETTLTQKLELKVTSSVTSERRELSDSICRLIDAKTINKCVISLVQPVLKYLIWCVRSSHRDSVNARDSVEFNSAMTDIKVTVHTLNKFLQKMDEVRLESEEGDGIIMLCVAVIKQENALLDCQTSCAMTLSLVYRRLHGHLAAGMLIRDLFLNPRPEFKVTDMQTMLCLLTGLLGGLTPTELVSTVDGQEYTVLELVTEKVFESCDTIEEASPSKYSLSRCLIVYTAKLSLCTGTSVLPNYPHLHKRLLHYIYNHIEDPVDAVRFQAKNIFENVIKIQQSLCEDRDSLVDLARDLVSMDWHRKGKYGLLSILHVYLDTAMFLELCPNMPSLMLATLDDVGMSNYVSDLYEKLMVKHNGCVSEATWQSTWLDPVVAALSQPDLRHGVTTFVLPKVLQADKSGMKYIIPSLINGQLGTDSLLVLVTCLKRARCLGYLPQTDNVELWNDVIPRKLLTQALEHSDSGLRTEAFGLLCFNPKTTEIIPKTDLDLVSDFLVNNLTNQSPAFRQDLVSAFRKLISRVKESWNLFVKKRNQEQVQYYAVFVHELYEQFLQNVYVGVSYTRRSTALNLLVSCDKILIDVDSLPSIDDVAHGEHAENLVQMLTDTFEENKTHALTLLLRIDPAKLGLDSVEKVKAVYEISNELVVTTRPQDCTTAAYMHKLLVEQAGFVKVLGGEGEDAEVRRRLLLESLISELGRQVNVGQKDLIHASLHAPMYPVIHCTRYLLNDVVIKNIQPQTWRPLLDSLINLAFRACAVVSPVISHASPEGNVPVSDLIGGEGDDVSLSTVQDMPEYLVVCSWRTVKEASLLLGDLSNWPIHNETQDGFIKVENLLKIGQFYTDLLLESRHRGAFELAYAGFQPMCAMLWNSRLESTNKLPLQWLTQILTDIENSDEEGSRLCATRRSAGVPFYVLALVVTEPVNRGRKSLATAMQALLDMSGGEKSMCRIHALNCVRALYKDNRLGEAVLGYVSEGVRIAVLGFSAESWAVRNASTLLFSALMVRVFGVRRDRNVLSSKNSLSGRVFFYRYPKLFPFLLERIQACTDSISTLNPGLYPVLMILGRLTPSVLEGSDIVMNVAEFIPYVMRCAASPVLKTRQMGARALCPIVCKDQLDHTIVQICETLEQSRTQNLTHGLLLQLVVLLEDAKVRTLTIKDEVIRRIYKSNWLMGRRNTCYMTRCEYVHVVSLLMDVVTDHRFLKRLHEEVLVVIHQEVAALSPERNQCYTLFMAALVDLYISRADQFDDGRLLKFLTGHRLYEVREITLIYLRKRELCLPDLDKRLDKEQHPACQALLLEILALENNETLPRHNVRDMVPRRYDVMCARLRYLAGSGNDEDRECLVSEVLRLCQIEEDVVCECRIACADVMYQLRHLLVEKNALQTQLWSICLTLLLDDDDDVRSRMCDVIGQVSNHNDVISLSHCVALNRAVDLVLKTLSASECITFVTDILRGPEKSGLGEDRLFDKGEVSTYEDRLHLIILILNKFMDHSRVAKFTFCEKLVSNLYKTVSNDFQQNLTQTQTSLQRRFLATGLYSEEFTQNFGLFGALFVLDKIRTSLRMAEVEPNFVAIKTKYFSSFANLMWPLTKYA